MRLTEFAVPRPSADLILKLAKFRPQMIESAAPFLKDTVPELCANLPLESLKLAIETVFCAPPPPPITDPHKKAIEKDFGRYGAVWKGDVLHCIPCNCKINGTTAWWRGMKSQLPQLATPAIRTLSIPHTTANVERCNSYYKFTRTDKQHSLKDAHHLGHLTFVMNGVVPPPVAI